MIVMVVFAISSSLQIISVRAFSFNSTGSVDGNNTFECNANITLVCKTDKTPVNIVLGINGTQAVVCGEKCYENTPVLGRYKPNHNSTIGLINLHLPSVTEKDQTTLFTCHEGLSVITIQPKIKVYPKKNEMVMVINVVDNAVKIHVATGCVLLDRKIIFVWNIIKDVPNGVLQPFPTNNFTQNDTEDNGKCKAAENCGATGKTSEISFTKENDGTGERYYVQCTVLVPDEYAPETISVVSNRTFYLEIIHRKKQASDDNTLEEIIGGSVGGGIGLLVILLVILVICCCSCKCGKCCRCGPREKLQKNDTDNSNGSGCNIRFKYCPNFRVNSVPVSIETIGLHTAPRETSITCTWEKEFKSDTVVHLSYTNTETVEKGDRELTADEKQKRSCTIRNLQPLTKYSIVMKASDTRNGTIEKTNFTVRTLALKPPKRYEFLSIEDDKITVSWEPALSDTNQIFRLTFYNMVMRNSNGKEKEQTEVFVKYKMPVMRKTVTGLQKNTVYQFEIITFIGTKKSISLVDFVQTTGRKDVSEHHRTGQKLNTTECHFTAPNYESQTLHDAYRLEYIKS